MKKYIALSAFALAVVIIPLSASAQVTTPSISTGSATNTSTNGATMNATVNPNGLQTEVWFEYGTTSALGQVTPSLYVPAGTVNVTVPYTVSNLIANTNYSYRAVARHLPNGAAVQGSIVSFVTTGGGSCGTPTVYTNPPTASGYNSAVLSGSVAYFNSGTSMTFWFEYGTTYSLGQQTAAQTITVPPNGNTYPITAIAGNLLPNTTYYVQAVAQTLCGTTARGSIVTLTAGGGYYNQYPYGNNSCQYINGQWYPYGCTPYNNYNQYNNCQYINGQWYPYGCTPYNQYPYNGYPNYQQQIPPVATTNGATGVGTTEATMNASVTPNGSLTDAWFEYGTTAALGTALPIRSVGDGIAAQPRSTTVMTLRPGTTYYYQIVARNQWGTNRGAVQSFRTLGSSVPSTPTYNPPVSQPPVAETGNAVISLDPSVQNPKPTPGEEVVYTIGYVNRGTAPAQNATLTAILPADTDLIATVPAPSSQNGTQNVVISVGTVAPGQQGSVIIRAKVRETARPGAGIALTVIMDYVDRAGGHSVNDNANAEVSGSAAGTPAPVAAISNFFDDIPGYAWFFIFLLLVVLVVIYAIFRMRTYSAHEEHGGGHH